MFRLAAAALMLSACGAPVPVRLIDARPLTAVTADDVQRYAEAEDPFERVDDACTFWELPCVPDEHAYGVLTIILLADQPGHITIQPSDKSIGGHTLDAKGCKRSMLSKDSGFTLEHELGHAFGLGHADEAGNIMTIPDRLIEPVHTDEQMDHVQDNAGRFAACVEAGKAK